MVATEFFYDQTYSSCTALVDSCLAEILIASTASTPYMVTCLKKELGALNPMDPRWYIGMLLSENHACLRHLDLRASKFLFGT